MRSIHSEIREKSMHTADGVRDEMTRIVRMAPEPVFAGERIAELIRRAATRLGYSYARTKKLWYGEVNVIPAHEADFLRERKKQMMRARQVRLDHELEQLQRQLAAMEADK